MRFCSEGGPSEVNINEDVRIRVVAAVEQMGTLLDRNSAPPIASIDKEVFDEAQSHIYHLMQTDSLSKFFRSDVFKNSFGKSE